MIERQPPRDICAGRLIMFARRRSLAGRWISYNWLSYHLAFAPIGTVTATWLLLGFAAGNWEWWRSQDHLIVAGQVAPFGAVVYGTSAFLVERVGRLVWILIRRDEDVDKARRDGIEQGRREGREQGRQEAFHAEQQQPSDEHEE